MLKHEMKSVRGAKVPVRIAKEIDQFEPSMQNTRLTLLQRAGAGVTEAWTELDGVYRPFIMGWFRTQSVALPIVTI